MEFLKKMRSRENVEMVFKTICAVLVGIILVFLMERMIYGIYMDKIKENKASQYIASQCVAYCEEIEDGTFKVYLHNTKSGSWHIKAYDESKALIESAGYKDVVYRTPNAFDVSITGVHYIVIAVFIAGILGFYGWRFYKINKEYTKFEKKYKKTGKIFA